MEGIAGHAGKGAGSGYRALIYIKEQNGPLR